LEQHYDLTDKLIEFDGASALRVHEDGYCIFISDDRRSCTIYPHRPFDCRIFPVDWYLDARGQPWWVLWECPLSALLTPASIEQLLCELEEKEQAYLHEMLLYGNDSVSTQLKNEEGMHFIRPIRLQP